MKNLACRNFIYNKPCTKYCKYSHEKWTSRILHKKRLCFTFTDVTRGTLRYYTDGYSVFEENATEPTPFKILMMYYYPIQAVNISTKGFPYVAHVLNKRIQNIKLRSIILHTYHYMPPELIEIILDYDVPRPIYPYHIVYC